MNSLLKRLSGPLALLVVAIAGAGILWQGSPVGAAEGAVTLPAPALDPADSSGALQTAVFAGGCFWGVQAVFQHTDGVVNAVSGYAGGTVKDPSYEQVSSGTTGHAESVAIRYDPKKVSYGKLLQIFFSVAHNPTELNYQGPDHGTQYRSAIFTTTDEQKRIAAAYIEQLGKANAYKDKIVTEVKPLDNFYPAEDYHQDYATLNPSAMYIVINDQPKIDNLKTMFPDYWREQPALVSMAKSG